MIANTCVVCNKKFKNIQVRKYCSAICKGIVENRQLSIRKAELKYPCFNFATTSWYDWSGGEITQKTLERAMCSVDLVAESFEEELDLSKALHKIDLWKHYLMSHHDLVIVDHAEKLVEDKEGVHELEEWRAEVQLRELTKRQRKNLVPLIKQIDDQQKKFDVFVKEYRSEWPDKLWQLFVQIHGENEDNWFFQLFTIGEE